MNRFLRCVALICCGGAGCLAAPGCMTVAAVERFSHPVPLSEVQVSVRRGGGDALQVAWRAERWRSAVPDFTSASEGATEWIPAEKCAGWQLETQPVIGQPALAVGSAGYTRLASTGPEEETRLPPPPPCSARLSLRRDPGSTGGAIEARLPDGSSAIVAEIPPDRPAHDARLWAEVPLAVVADPIVTPLVAANLALVFTILELR